MDEGKVEAALIAAGLPKASVWHVLETLRKMTAERREELAAAILAPDTSDIPEAGAEWFERARFTPGSEA